MYFLRSLTHLNILIIYMSNGIQLLLFFYVALQTLENLQDNIKILIY